MQVAAVSKRTFGGACRVPGMESGAVLEVDAVPVVWIRRFLDMRRLPQAKPEAWVQTVA